MVRRETQREERTCQHAFAKKNPVVDSVRAERCETIQIPRPSENNRSEIKSPIASIPGPFSESKYFARAISPSQPSRML